MKSTTLDQLTGTMTVDGPALTNSTVRTSILDPSGKMVIPAGFWEVGKQIQITASGRISNVVTTPGTLVLDLNFLNTVPTNVIVANSGALALNVNAKTNVPWYLTLLLTCRSVGAAAAATLFFTGEFTSESVVGSPIPSVGGSGSLLLPAVTPGVGTGFDSTLQQTVDMFATFSVNTATTSIQCHQFSLLTLN